jgi:hypothetical protein
MEQAQQAVHKVVLSSGKEVLFKPMKIKYQNLALRAVGNKADGNSALLGSMMQEELLKILLVQIDGKSVDKKLVEDLDGLFAYEEYLQVCSVIAQLMGGQSLGELKTEIVTI